MIIRSFVLTSLALWVSTCSCAAEPGADFSVSQSDKAVTVICQKNTPYRAMLDLAHIAEKIPSPASVAYEYAMEISKVPAAEARPHVDIILPLRDSDPKLGETITYSVMGKDSQGKALPADSYRWDIYYNFKVVKTYTGESCTHTLPATAAEIGNRDDVVATVTATDAAGRKSVEYVAINIAIKQAAK